MDPHRVFFEDLSQRWDGMQSSDRLERLRVLLEPYAGQLGRSDAILDLGTGTGAMLPVLRLYAPASRLVAVDLANGMLQRARARGAHAALLQADVHRLPLLDASFDLALCHAAFPHFTDKPRSLRELRRLLRPGGYLLILHDTSRDKVNAIHSSLPAPLNLDLLPPLAQTGELMQQAGFCALQLQEGPGMYAAIGRVADDLPDETT